MDDGKNINIIARDRANIGANAAKKDPSQHQWVKKNIDPQKKFDAQKEKETFKEVSVTHYFRHSYDH
jgi:hypothetical protein